MVARDAVRARVDPGDGGVPIKFEVIREGYLGGLLDPIAEVRGIPCLHPQDSMATKLMANADRGLDTRHAFRDMIDLAVLARHWLGVEKITWEKVKARYGDFAEAGVIKTLALMKNPESLRRAFDALDVSPAARDIVHGLVLLNEDAVLPALATGHWVAARYPDRFAP